MPFPLFTAMMRRDASGAPAEWERPGPTPAGLRRDAVAAGLWWVIGVSLWWLTEQFREPQFRVDSWQAMLGFAFLVAPLAVRRRWPLVAVLVASVVFLVVGMTVPSLNVQATFQAAYFASLYAAAAWAKDTRAFWICSAVVLGVMFVWVVVSFTMARSAEQFLAQLPQQDGPIPPLMGYALYTLVLNVAYFGGSLFFGRRGRAAAWQRETLLRQTDQLLLQADELARRAVVDERLRIARELHDVVAHHISAVGVQASAARRVQSKSPETTTRLLGQIEESSRQALAETRSLLGVLRTDTTVGFGEDTRGERSPEPGLGELPLLLEGSAAGGVAATLQRVEHPDVPLDSVPSSLGLSLYRVTQEALSNVRRHSTATSAAVTLRTGVGPDGAWPGPWAEVEIVDSGRVLPSTGGGGFGLRGIRERAALHHGEAELGPRTTGGSGTGYRVRVRLPLQRGGKATASTADAGTTTNANTNANINTNAQDAAS